MYYNFFCFLSRLGVIKILETYFEPKTIALPDLILLILKRLTYDLSQNLYHGLVSSLPKCFVNSE
jgi:hypothetical protein